MMGTAYRQTPGAMIAVLSLIFYSDGNCFAGENIEWMKFDELPRAYRGCCIKLEEEESVKNVRAALVGLREGPGPAELLVYNFNPSSCGSGGCSLSIFMSSPEGVMKEVFSVTTDGGIDEGGHFYIDLSLGNGYTNGMRNLRFADSVTWIWNGQSYDLK